MIRGETFPTCGQFKCVSGSRFRGQCEGKKKDDRRRGGGQGKIVLKTCLVRTRWGYPSIKLCESASSLGPRGEGGDSKGKGNWVNVVSIGRGKSEKT